MAGAGDAVVSPQVIELLEERDRLAAAVAARDQFLALVSHELRTPVQALLLQLDATLRVGAGRHDEAKWMRGRIVRSIDKVRELSRMLDRYLEVTRIEAGRLDLDSRDVDLVAIAAEVLRRMGDELTWAGCAVSFEGPPSLIGRWDPTRLDVVISNLLSNARKYGAGQPILVRVDEAAGRARLIVEDHGPGISPKDRERIFQRFERIQSTTGP
jgi:signal transduction histidine kinase